MKIPLALLLLFSSVALAYNDAETTKFRGLGNHFLKRFLTRKVTQSDVHLFSSKGITALQLGADPNIIFRYDDLRVLSSTEFTPLSLATLWKMHPLFDELIKAGADINATDGLATTIYYAASSSNITALWKLLQQPNIQIDKVRGEELFNILFLIEKNDIKLKAIPLDAIELIVLALLKAGSPTTVTATIKYQPIFLSVLEIAAKHNWFDVCAFIYSTLSSKQISDIASDDEASKINRAIQNANMHGHTKLAAALKTGNFPFEFDSVVDWRNAFKKRANLERLLSQPIAPAQQQECRSNSKKTCCTLL